jgi:hypothetical protein
MVTRPARLRRRRTRSGFALIDVIIGGVLLVIGLSAILALGARSYSLQQRGEREVIAAALLDETLSTVLAEGPEEYPELHSLAGSCDAPFGDFEYFVSIDDGAEGVPYKVRVTIRHSATDEEWRAETLIAMRLGDEPNPERAPPEPIDREGRYQEMEEEENGG